MTKDAAKPTVLLLAPRTVSIDNLVAALDEAGYLATVADTPVALQEALRRVRQPHAVYLELRLTAPRALQIMLALRKALPAECLIHVAPGYFDDETLARFVQAGAVRRAALGDPQAMARSLVDRTPAPARKPPQAARYDSTIVNCFLSTTSEVLEYYSGEKPTAGKPGVVQTKRTPQGFVTAVSDFTGPKWHGTALLTCDRSFIVDVTARSNGVARAEADKDTEAIVATLEMLADQIFGKAEMLLGRIGYEVSMGSPEVHVGANDRPVIAAAGPVMVVPFVVAKLRFYIGFSLTARARAG